MIEDIRLLLGKKVEISDELLNLYIKMVTQRILNYTNLKSMPEGLIYDVLIPMVIEIVNENHKIEDSKVGSVTEAGRTVVFRQDDFVTVTLAHIATRMSTYKDQLNKFRRIV